MIALSEGAVCVTSDGLGNAGRVVAHPTSVNRMRGMRILRIAPFELELSCNKSDVGDFLTSAHAVIEDRMPRLSLLINRSLMAAQDEEMESAEEREAVHIYSRLHRMITLLHLLG
jgi:hypothetical protein